MNFIVSSDAIRFSFFLYAINIQKCGCIKKIFRKYHREIEHGWENIEREELLTMKSFLYIFYRQRLIHYLSS